MVPKSFKFLFIHFFPVAFCLSNSICNFVIYHFSKQASKALVEVYKLIVLIDQINDQFGLGGLYKHDKFILPVVFFSS